MHDADIGNSLLVAVTFLAGSRIVQVNDDPVNTRSYRHAAAIDAAEAGIARLSEMNRGDQRLQLLTGKAQIAAGKKEKGESALKDLLRTTSPPLPLSSIHPLLV